MRNLVFGKGGVFSWDTRLAKKKGKNERKRREGRRERRPRVERNLETHLVFFLDAEGVWDIGRDGMHAIVDQAC